MRLSQFDDIDGTVYHWFKLARQRQVPVNGPMLQEEALKIAEALGNRVFKASLVSLIFFMIPYELIILNNSYYSGTCVTVTWIKRSSLHKDHGHEVPSIFPYKCMHYCLH